ncbi:MAG: Hpt domain-containing protein [Anaerolineales bacterium]|nr:Hpt domain-containing protein [Anaerolineales bacterium]
MSLDTTALDVYREMLGEEAEAFVKDLVNTYIKSTTKLLEYAQSALQQDDVETFTRTAHTIKSSSAALGAAALSQIAAELEMAGRTGDISQVQPEYKRLKAEFIKVRQALTLMIS